MILATTSIYTVQVLRSRTDPQQLHGNELDLYSGTGYTVTKLSSHRRTHVLTFAKDENM